MERKIIFADMPPWMVGVAHILAHMKTPVPCVLALCFLNLNPNNFYILINVSLCIDMTCQGIILSPAVHYGTEPCTVIGLHAPIWVS